MPPSFWVRIFSDICARTALVFAHRSTHVSAPRVATTVLLFDVFSQSKLALEVSSFVGF